MRRRVKKFNVFMLIYIFVWIVGIISVCRWVWKGLSRYQKDYDKALEASHPEIFMDEWMASLDKGALMEYLEEDNTISYTPYEAKETVLKCISKQLNLSGSFSYEKHEKYKDNAPVYVLRSDNKPIALICLKREIRLDHNEPDIWSIKQICFGNYVSADEKCTIRVRKGDKVTINGVSVNASDLKSSNVCENELLAATSEFSGGEYIVEEYSVSGLYEKPVVNAVSSDGYKLLNEVYTQNLYDYTSGNYEGFSSTVYEIAVKRVFEYAEYFNLKIPYEEYRDTLKPDTQMWQVALSLKQSIKWNDEALEMSSDEARMENVIRINDNVFAADVYMKITIVCEKFTKKDELNYRCVFYTENGCWYLIYLSVI